MKWFIFSVLYIMSFMIYAFQVEPMVQWLTTHGAQSQSTYSLYNGSDLELPIEVLIFSREMQANGEEGLTPAHDDFIVMPPMASINANSTQRFIVKYLGDPTIAQAKSYRVYFNQLPLKESEYSSSQISVLVSFGSLAFVAPQNSNEILETTLADNAITITNIGNGIANLAQLNMTISGKNKSIQTKWRELSAYFPVSYLDPDQSVTITMDADWNTLGEPITSVTLN
ncbi:fimbria/pilus periplasmic chaperone [Vibrio astriarenae]